jgi:hypothetical protein
MIDLLITKKHTAIIILRQINNKIYFQIIFGEGKKKLFRKLYHNYFEALKAARELGFGNYYRIDTEYDLYKLTHTKSFYKLLTKNIKFIYSPSPLFVENNWRDIYLEYGF